MNWRTNFIELCLAKASWARWNGWVLMENAYLSTAADLYEGDADEPRD